MSKRISQGELESYLWGAATLLRGTIDAGDSHRGEIQTNTAGCKVGIISRVIVGVRTKISPKQEALFAAVEYVVTKSAAQGVVACQAGNRVCSGGAGEVVVA